MHYAQKTPGGSEWRSSRIERLDGGKVAKQRRGDTEAISLSEVSSHKRCLSKLRANARTVIRRQCSDVGDFGYAVMARGQCGLLVTLLPSRRDERV